jgi:hypothetical protein
MPKALDLTGQRFGKLRVVERHGSYHGRSFWKCVCSCGRVTYATGKNLKNGSTKSCGCLHRQAAALNLPDNAKPIGFKKKNKKGYVLVKTACGFEFEHRLVVASDLGRELQPDEIVHHVDGNKANNHLDNLEIIKTGKHTVLHHTGAMRSQETKMLISQKRKKYVLDYGHIGRKLNEKMVADIKHALIQHDSSYKKLSDAFGVSKGCIAAIAQGRIWRHVNCQA